MPLVACSSCVAVVATFRRVLTILNSSAGDRRESAAIESVKALFDALGVPARTIHCCGRQYIVQTRPYVFYEVILLVQQPEYCERAGEQAEA